ncbi:magnesium transporter CorA family protein [uncultured Jatrophihabitans sp.]|uniref:magnesium transporter CorA family protein n=1 Tax=uncultured Jatrophihabitans sp. TaxID=1610747 RepID=UPI0035CA3C42
MTDVGMTDAAAVRGIQHCTIRTRVWRNGALEAENFPFEQVSDYLQEPDCLVWADLMYPDHESLLKLAEELSLDPHAIEDAEAAAERPKATRYTTHLFLTAYAVQHDADFAEVRLGRVSAFATERAFVTVRLDDSLDMDAVLRRWDDNADLIKYGPRLLSHGLLDEIVDGYFETVESLDDAVEAIEDILFDENAQAAREVSRRTFQLRRSLVQVRRVVLPMREVVNTLMHRTGADNAVELAPYYEDLYDHVLRAAEWTESLRDMITSIFETNMSLSDTRMNLVMKQLTAWAAIIAVPTAVTGYFGQNVPYPGFGQHWGFWLSVGVVVAIALALYVSFKRRDWL